MKSMVLNSVVLCGMLLGLPWIGIWCAGVPTAPYLEFPPHTLYVQLAPFSWPVFAAYAALISAVILPLLYRNFQNFEKAPAGRFFHFPFPRWGWAGVVGCLLFWTLAWTRFPWFRPLQPHTFAPLWLSFIVVINALCKGRTGSCMLTHRPRFFLALFPVSAGFWWFFEYLNRFVQNWHYTGERFGPWQYFLFATLAFATVLPAVWGMQELIVSFSWVRRGFSEVRPVPCRAPKRTALAALSAAGAGLALLGVFPNTLFPLLWISPLLIFTSLQTLSGEAHVLSDVGNGDWHRIVSFAAAALCCGFFWEMWNMFSFARWEYRIPFVQRFHLFEMPLLGYAGYLPFGLECAAVGDVLGRMVQSR